LYMYAPRARCASGAAGCAPVDCAGLGRARQAVLGAMRPGVRWPDMHLLAERALLGGLKAAGCVRGSLDEMMERRLGAVFMPHGGPRRRRGGDVRLLAICQRRGPVCTARRVIVRAHTG